jgi:hypothetical protein
VLKTHEYVIAGAIAVGLALAGVMFFLQKPGEKTVPLTEGGTAAAPTAEPTGQRPSAAPSPAPPPNPATSAPPTGPASPPQDRLIPDPAPYPEDDWIERQADPASTYALLDDAGRRAVKAQALNTAFAATSGGDLSALFQPGSTPPISPVAGATSVATRAEGSGVQLAGARGAMAEFTVLVPFEAKTAAGDLSGQALWQITMTGQGDVWLAETAVAKGVLP